MNAAGRIRLELVSDPVYLSAVRELVSAASQRAGFSEDHAAQIALAVDEALCNIIRHGYNRRPDGPVTMEIRALPVDTAGRGGIVIVFEDEARQVDPAAIRGRDLDDIRPGGLGVHIMQQLMDEVRYERREGGTGMRLTLSRRWPAASISPAPQGSGEASSAGPTPEPPTGRSAPPAGSGSDRSSGV